MGILWVLVKYLCLLPACFVYPSMISPRVVNHLQRMIPPPFSTVEGGSETPSETPRDPKLPEEWREEVFLMKNNDCV